MTGDQGKSKPVKFIYEFIHFLYGDNMKPIKIAFKRNEIIAFSFHIYPCKFIDTFHFFLFGRILILSIYLFGFTLKIL